MPNMAVPSIKTIISFQPDGEDDPIVVHGVLGISDLDSAETAEYEVDTLESDNKEYLLDLPDLGTCNMDLNYNLDDPGQMALYTAWKNSGGGTLIVKFNSSQGVVLDKNTWTASVLVKKMGSVGAGRGKQVTGSATFRVNSSAWTHTA